MVALANRTIIDAFTAGRVVLRAAQPSPLPPLRLPKHVRYRCATPRRFVLGNRIVLHRHRREDERTPLPCPDDEDRRHGRRGPFKTSNSPDSTSVTVAAMVPGWSAADCSWLGSGPAQAGDSDPRVGHAVVDVVG